MTNIKIEQELISKAKEALKNSYSPYSNFKVGAAVLTENGKIFVGTNIENASYGLSICAERTAIVSAIASGERKIEKIAIISSNDKDYCYPCGACRAVLSEFATKETQIYCCKTEQDYKTETIDSILPNNFVL